ncbi:hypothetical protein [Pontibacter pudoricolor]|uniref:hypothetical protein n=1 Tax=Pontibacter pudoricolor TaxID=2694930 RepID=UPI001391FDE9|nr:hypothetical protein [Pontibacter pudoricolor]
MENRHITQRLLTILLISIVLLSGCRTSTATENTETENKRSLAPQRVDIRGQIVMLRYHEGQFVMEVEGRAPSPDSRYNRAYVLVLPTTEIIGLDGKSVNMNELTQGQNVAVLLRGQGEGDFVGVGVARKMWLEEFY